MALAQLANAKNSDVERIVAIIHELVENNDGEPRRSDVSRTLKRMADIAKQENERDPALIYKDDSVIITDPFFAFDLRWKNR